MISLLWPVIAVIALICLVGYLAWPNSDVLDLAPNPARKPVVVLVALIGLGALGAGGYYGKHAVECMGYEEDYLNSVSQLKSITSTLGLLDTPEVTKALIGIREREMKESEAALLSLREHCGQRAAETALRKGSELLLP